MGEMGPFVMPGRSEGKDQSLWVLEQMGWWEFDVGEWFLVTTSENKAQALIDITDLWSLWWMPVIFSTTIAFHSNEEDDGTELNKWTNPMVPLISTERESTPSETSPLFVRDKYF